jgi:hypothetical protein
MQLISRHAMLQANNIVEDGHWQTAMKKQNQ